MSDARDDLIRITREEALSGHVDDLLKRQTSLRGEHGITRTRRRWYYQNWFVFMLVGGLAAFCCWALLEPYFDDLFYVQGPITQLDPDREYPRRVERDGAGIELAVPGKGWFKIGDIELWVIGEMTRELRADGTTAPFDPRALREGIEVGVHVEHLDAGVLDVALARFVRLFPPSPPPAKACMSLVEQARMQQAAGLLIFPLMAGLIGLCIGGVDGLVCRLLRRALLAGGVGLLTGFIGGFVSGILAELAYAPLHTLAMGDAGVEGFTTAGFLVQTGGRALAWALAGVTMGLGQGLALRSKQLFLFGLLGGLAGGLLGGLLFDPIDMLLLGADKPSAHWSRLVGFLVIGLSVGAMIGIVELLARDAWLRMVEGALAGKEFLIFRDTMRVGSSPRSDIYIFNDDGVAGNHAVIRTAGDVCEIQGVQEAHPVLVNGRAVRQARVRHGDRISIGGTVFVFERRGG